MSKYLTKVRRDAISLATQPDRWYQSCVLLHGHADAAEALLLEVAAAGVVLDDPRIGYVEIQIDRETWQAIRAAVGAKEDGNG